MSGFELNKIVAAVLVAGIVAMVSGYVSRMLVDPKVELEEDVYAFQVEEDTATETAAAEAEPEEPAGPEPIEPILASASVDAGETLAGRQCGACHSFEQGGPNKVGPNLWDIVGATKAHLDNFNYSDTLAGMDGDWTYEALNGFLWKPMEYAPGTKMSYRGLSKPEDRANVVAYLRSLSSDPVPLPE